MPDFVHIQLSERAQRLLDKAGLSQRIGQFMARAMDDENHYTIGTITEKRLHFPKDGPPVPDGLRYRTGNLARSLRATRATYTGTANGMVVSSSIGSNVKYAGIHEFGGQTGAHEIRAKNKKALKIPAAGGMVFFLRKKVNHPGSKFPARRYIFNTVEECSDKYARALSRSITLALEGEK